MDNVTYCFDDAINDLRVIKSLESSRKQLSYAMVQVGDLQFNVSEKETLRLQSRIDNDIHDIKKRFRENIESLVGEIHV